MRECQTSIFCSLFTFCHLPWPQGYSTRHLSKQPGQPIWRTFIQAPF
jgi:hypothetical protein